MGTLRGRLADVYDKFQGFLADFKIDIEKKKKMKKRIEILLCELQFGKLYTGVGPEHGRLRELYPAVRMDMFGLISDENKK